MKNMKNNVFNNRSSCVGFNYKVFYETIMNMTTQENAWYPSCISVKNTW